MYLAQQKNRLCTIQEISEWHQISKAHLVKIVHDLSRKGYIKSTQGKGGGIQLFKSASKINLGEFVRNAEPNFNIVECFDEKNNTCKLKNNCKLKKCLYLANKAFLDVLDQYQLEDISSD
jgi:Rrf2 family nitric oxide-sensitive transcriptional repressor